MSQTEIYFVKKRESARVKKSKAGSASRRVGTMKPQENRLNQTAGQGLIEPLCLQIEHALGAHVEQQVEYAEVRLKAVALLIHLIISLWSEHRVGHAVLRAYGVAVVVDAHAFGLVAEHVARSRLHMRLYVDEFAHFGTYLSVEIVKEGPLLLKKRPDVVGIILKERRLAVGAHQRVPVYVAPVAVVAYAHILHEALWHLPLFIGPLAVAITQRLR